MLRTRTMITCIFILWALKVKGNELCHGQQNDDGTTTFYYYSGTYCDQYSWLINGTSVAHDDDFNKSMVLSQDSHSINFKSCHKSVNYTNICTGTIVDCSSNCTKASPAEAPTEHRSQDRNNVIVALVGAFICILIVACIVYRCFGRVTHANRCVFN